MKFKLNIEMGNSNMMTRHHVARTLKAIARDIDTAFVLRDEMKIRDINGNTVGSWEFTEEDGDK